MVTSDPSERQAVVDYRQRSGAASGNMSRRTVVIIHHAADSAAASGIETMSALAADGYVKPALVASVSASGVGARSLLSAKPLPADILDALSRAGRIDRLDIVSVSCSALLDDAAIDSLAEATAELVQECRLLAPPDTRVQDCRIAFPVYGEPAAVNFAGGDKRIVVVPEDRRLPSAVARPLNTSDPAAFGAHVAVETISICGLWETMHDDPLGRDNPADAKPELVRVARSLVRSARLHCPSPSGAIHHDGSLPAPAGAIRTTTPQDMADKCAKLLVGGRLRPPPASKPPDAVAPGSGFFKSFARRVGSDIRNFPRRLRDGLAGEFQHLVDDMAEVMVTGAPELESLWDRDAPSGADGPPACDHRPRPAEISWPEDWDALLQGAFGVADRARCADDVRAAAAGSRDQVLTAHEDLVGATEPETLQEVFGYLACIDGDPATGRAETAATGEHGSRYQRAPALLPGITDEFLRHKREACQHVDACHETLQDLSPGRQQHTAGAATLSAAVPICLAFGTLLAVLAWTVLFPPLRNILAIGDIVTDAGARARLWILPTSALAVALLVLNMPRETLRQQRYLILGAAAITGVCATLLVWPGPVRSVVTIDYGSSALSAGILAVFVMAIMAVCTVNITGHGVINTRAARWSSALLLLYLTGCAVVVLNDADFRPAALDDHGAELLFILTPLAAALVLVSYAMVTLACYRRELKFKQWRQQVDWWVTKHQEAHQEADIRDAVYTHWLGSACALHRIIRSPYGASGDWPDPAARCESGAHRVDTPEHSLVKAILFECEPTEAGLERFGRILEAELVRPGWLYLQYRRASEAYRSRYGIVPEACSYPLTLGEGLIETTDGDRWPFVQQLYRGDFDSALMERVTDFVDGDGLDELFDDVTSFEVASGAHTDESPLAMLAEIVEDPEPPIPPAMLEPSARIERNDLGMKSWLWWPERLGSAPTTIESTPSRSLRVRGTIVHQAIRIDLSDPIPLNALACVTSLHTADDGLHPNEPSHRSGTEQRF